MFRPLDFGWSVSRRIGLSVGTRPACRAGYLAAPGRPMRCWAVLTRSTLEIPTTRWLPWSDRQPREEFIGSSRCGTRVPLRSVVPASHGRCARPVNLVDPTTLADLCSLEAPRNLTREPAPLARCAMVGSQPHHARFVIMLATAVATSATPRHEELYDHSVRIGGVVQPASRPDTAEVRRCRPSSGGRGIAAPRQAPAAAVTGLESTVWEFGLDHFVDQPGGSPSPPLPRQRRTRSGRRRANALRPEKACSASLPTVPHRPDRSPSSTGLGRLQRTALAPDIEDHRPVRPSTSEVIEAQRHGGHGRAAEQVRAPCLPGPGSSRLTRGGIAPTARPPPITPPAPAAAASPRRRPGRPHRLRRGRQRPARRFQPHRRRTSEHGLGGIEGDTARDGTGQPGRSGTHTGGCMVGSAMMKRRQCPRPDRWHGRRDRRPPHPHPLRRAQSDGWIEHRRPVEDERLRCAPRYVERCNDRPSNPSPSMSPPAQAPILRVAALAPSGGCGVGEDMSPLVGAVQVHRAGICTGRIVSGRTGEVDPTIAGQVAGCRDMATSSPLFSP